MAMSRSLRRDVGDVAVADVDRAAVDLLQPREHPQRRRLARPGRADEHQQLAVGDVEVEAGHGGHVGVRVDPRGLLVADFSHGRLRHLGCQFAPDALLRRRGRADPVEPEQGRARPPAARRRRAAPAGRSARRARTSTAASSCGWRARAMPPPSTTSTGSRRGSSRGSVARTNATISSARRSTSAAATASSGGLGDHDRARARPARRSTSSARASPSASASGSARPKAAGTAGSSAVRRAAAVLARGGGASAATPRS